MPTWKEAKQQSNGYFFDEAAMSFFNSRLNGNPKRGEDGSYYGVVSSKPPHGDRFYDVVRVQPDGQTTRAHDSDEPFSEPVLQRFDTRDKAMSALGYMLNEDSEEPSPNYYDWF